MTNTNNDTDQKAVDADGVLMDDYLKKEECCGVCKDEKDKDVEGSCCGNCNHDA